MIAVHYAENSPRKDEFQVPSVDSPVLPPMGAVAFPWGALSASGLREQRTSPTERQGIEDTHGV